MFASVSVRSILNNMTANCLLSSSPVQQTVLQLLPGQMFNPDAQCQIMLGSGAFYCGVRVFPLFYFIRFALNLLSVLKDDRVIYYDSINRS